MITTDNFGHLPFIQGGGQMGELIRAHDWINSPLGIPNQWPYSLRTNVSNLLHAPMPTLVLSGREFICFYNDAVIPSLGPEKHPAIGRPASEIWAEGWDFIGPLLESVYNTGEPVMLQDVPVVFYRNGILEDVYWTFSYSLTLDDNGDPGGVLVICLETTEAVLGRRKIEEAKREVITFFEQSPVAIAIIDSEALIFRMANSFYGDLVGRSAESLVGKPLSEALPELAGQGFDQLLWEVIRSGKPFTASEMAVDIILDGKLEKIFVDLTYQPRREADQAISGVLVVATEVTQQVLIRKKIEQSEAHLELLSNTVPAMIFYLDARQRYQSYNETFMQWFKVTQTEVIGKTVKEFLGEAAYKKVLPHLLVAFTGQQERYEMFAPSNMGSGKWLNITYTPHKATDGTVLGLIVHAADITHIKQAELDLRESEAALQVAIELAELGTWQIDAVTGAISYSDRLRHWLGVQDAVLTADASPRIHQNDKKRIHLALLKALKKGGTGRFDEIYTITNALTGQDRIIHASGQAAFSADGEPISITGTAQDVTIQKQLQLALENQVQTRTEELEVMNEELTATNERLRSMNIELTESTELLVRSNENLQRFAYVASHDLQEPLRKIQQFADILQKRDPGFTGENLAHLQRIQSAASRMSALIKDLLDFSESLRIVTRAK